MSKTHVYERFDVFSDEVFENTVSVPNNEGDWVRAEAAINREAVLQAQIRTLEVQLKDLKSAGRPRQFILAAIPDHARYIARHADWPPGSWTYVDREHRLQGQRGAVLWLHETAPRHPDYERIMDMARALGMSMIAIRDVFEPR